MASPHIPLSELEPQENGDQFQLDESSEPQPSPHPQANAPGPSPQKRRKKPWFRRIVLMGLLIGGGFLLAPALSEYATGTTEEQDGVVGDVLLKEAKRLPFRITVTERGSLESMKNATLVSSVEGSTTIISIIPEGTIVKEGDVLCELDSSAMREELKQQEITVTQAEAAEQQAKESVEIQKTQNESDKAKAKLDLELAKLDLDAYKDAQFDQEKNKIVGEVETLSEELTRAQEDYDFSRRMAKKGYRSQNQVEASRIAVTKADINLRVAKESLHVLTEFTKKRTLAELQANYDELIREQDRVARKANAALAGYNADYEARKLTLEVERKKLERLQQQIEACTLKAPQDGEVIYASEQSRRSSDANVIEEGATVRERQAIIKLPDFSQMKVDARIHESRIGNVKVGLPVNIRVDAHPGKIYNGIVDNVASVPAPADWMNREMKHYETVIRLTDDPELIRKLRPGLTAGIEILVRSRDSVLQIPIQAVITIGDKRFVFVHLGKKEYERREVMIGESNDEFVEVLDGVQEGEEVVMSPRTNFGTEIRELEDKMGATQKKNARKGGPKGPPGAKRGPGGPKGPANTQAGKPNGSGGKTDGKRPVGGPGKGKAE